MQKYFIRFSILSLLFLPLMLSGCNAIGDKDGSLSVIYAATALLSMLILIGYFFLSKKKISWFLLLFVSVAVVNIGYFALAISRGLDEALLANRLAYLGSVFLPLAMLMIILNVANFQYRSWLPGLLLGIGVIVFLIAASPGYLDIYYREVFFEKVNGVTILNKVYGPLHGIYLVYLLGYFAAMVATIVHATLKDKIESLAYAAILAVAVFVNIGVWMIEQLVRIDFEILSVSYIISESFLLGLQLFMAETEKQKSQLVKQSLTGTEKLQPLLSSTARATEEFAPVREQMDPIRINIFVAGISALTPKELALYECYAAGMSTAQIMEKLNIKENTLKFHNKNLYGKLGVSSRKQLLEIHRHISRNIVTQ